MKEDVILQVNGLKTYFFDRKGKVPAVDGVDFMIRKGETLGIVGESGCGKSVTSMSILKLLPPEGKVVEGEILFKGRDLTKCTSREMEKVRGKEIAMIFQEPMTSLNPVYTVGKQIEEMLRISPARTILFHHFTVLFIIFSLEFPSDPILYLPDCKLCAVSQIQFI